LLPFDLSFSVFFVSKSIINDKRKRGRPATGMDPMVGLRMPPEERREIEAWGAEQSPPLKFSKAVRQLIRYGLDAVQKAAARRAKRESVPPKRPRKPKD
jgi:hypothetical protein